MSLFTISYNFRSIDMDSSSSSTTVLEKRKLDCDFESDSIMVPSFDLDECTDTHGEEEPSVPGSLEFWYLFS